MKQSNEYIANSMLHRYLLALERRRGRCQKAVNLGCGNDIRPGWINIDLVSENPEVVKCDFRSSADLQLVEYLAADLIFTSHVIGYLNFSEAIRFFGSIYKGLVPGGKLIIEFPDIEKIAKKLLATKECTSDDYDECIRGIYGYPLENLIKPITFPTYVYGWSAAKVTASLSRVGFRNIRERTPLTHNVPKWRDTRIVATK